ncbi:MAG: hypothetical protein IPF79_04615 [Ignavibacteria bacterium]|nr:hypothetical protein [Ignavibacteria bacterium]
MSSAPTATSAGAGDSGKIVKLDGSGRIASSMMPVGIGADTKDLVASEALSAGDLVNVWDDAGTQKARKADASNGRRAVGFVLAGVAGGATATVYFEGTISGMTGLTIGGAVYLGTSGANTQTAPSTAGHISQEIGLAVSTTEISFEPQRPITIA